jgi:hypothetical protein
LTERVLPAIELELDGRVRERPGFQEEEQLGLEIIPVAAVGDDDGATPAAVDLGPIPSQRFDEVVDRVGIAETYRVTT